MDKFLFYDDWKWLFKPKKKKKKGVLIDAIFTYYETGRDTTKDKSEPLRMAFGVISEEMARDKERRRHISKMRRIAGLRSASLRKSKEQ